MKTIKKFSYADAVTPITSGTGESDNLLRNEVKFMGSYASAVEVPNGMPVPPPPAYEAIQSRIVNNIPLSPPSTTLISVYSTPLRVEYEESDWMQPIGFQGSFRDYYVCCRMCCAFIGLCCCLTPLIILLIIIVKI